MSGPYAFSDHRLVDHLRKTSRLALETVKGNEEVLIHRLKAADLDLQPERIQLMVRIACISHDIGKGADVYQKRVSRESKASFQYHEVPSAVIASRICARLGLQEKETALVCLTVLQHMSAIRDLSELSIDDVVRKFRDGWRFYSHGGTLVKFLMEELRIKVELDVSIRDAEEMLRWLTSLARHRDLRWTKLYCLLLGPLMVGDNLDSHDKRKGNVSHSREKFIEELRAVLANV